MDRRLLAEMGAAYRALEAWLEIVKAAVRQAGLECASIWHSSHYARDGRGEFRRQAYPIPVVIVEELCDIELGFSALNATAKLARAQSLAFPYEALPPCSFEACGVEHHLSDCYHAGQSLEALRKNAASSHETEIGFAFSLSMTIEPELVDFLKGSGFSY